MEGIIIQLFLLTNLLQKCKIHMKNHDYLRISHNLEDIHNCVKLTTKLVRIHKVNHVFNSVQRLHLTNLSQRSIGLYALILIYLEKQKKYFLYDTFYSHVEILNVIFT